MRTLVGMWCNSTVCRQTGKLSVVVRDSYAGVGLALAHNDNVAQMAERLAVNQYVIGSIPIVIAKTRYESYINQEKKVQNKRF